MRFKAEVQTLFEYGGLNVETYKLTTDEVSGFINLNAIPAGLYHPKTYLEKPRSFGNGVMTFPIGDYHLDSASLEADINGKVYMVSDVPTLMSDDFKLGIEKVMMEDYSDTLKWDFERKTWGE